MAQAACSVEGRASPGWSVMAHHIPEGRWQLRKKSGSICHIFSKAVSKLFFNLHSACGTPRSDVKRRTRRLTRAMLLRAPLPDERSDYDLLANRIGLGPDRSASWALMFPATPAASESACSSTEITSSRRP